MDKKIKIIFAGTPEFSVPYLEGLIADPDFFVAGVITQSDKPSGRNQALLASPVKTLALSRGLKIWQPEKLRSDETIAAELAALSADILVVVAYGQIIPQRLLDLFPCGAFNVHPSLLPKYRGASPIQSALLNGEKETGITIMLMDEKMDHGPILIQEKIALSGNETNESLHQTCAEIGVDLLISAIKGYLSGGIKPRDQDHSAATFCATITKDDARINWSLPAQSIKNKIYAFNPWPATWTTFEGKRLKIFPPAEIAADISGLKPEAGSLAINGERMAVRCGQGVLLLGKVQLEGKNAASAADFCRGQKNLSGKSLI